MLWSKYMETIYRTAYRIIQLNFDHPALYRDAVTNRAIFHGWTAKTKERKEKKR